MRSSLVVLVLLGTLCAVYANSSGGFVDVGKHITGAAGVYKWGNAVWREEYEPAGAEHMTNPNTGVPLTGPGGYEGLNGPPYNPTPMTAAFKNQWNVNHWSAIGWRYGMLALTGRTDGSEVTMTRKGGAQYGRWESKMFFNPTRKSTNSWRAILELVPVKSSQYHCGAQTITYMDFSMATLKSSFQINTLPKNSFKHSIALSAHTLSGYHAFAVEVSPTHISWFVDDRVVMTEKRKAALSHPVLTIRIRFMGTNDRDFPVAADATPNLQFDWNRYFSLKRPNARSINGVPRCARETNPNAC